jgi:hypothetical protein
MKFTPYSCQYVRWPQQLKRCANFAVEIFWRDSNPRSQSLLSLLCCGAARGEERALEHVRIYTPTNRTARSMQGCRKKHLTVRLMPDELERIRKMWSWPVLKYRSDIRGDEKKHYTHRSAQSLSQQRLEPSTSQECHRLS